MPQPIMPAGIKAIIHTRLPRRQVKNLLYYVPDTPPTAQTHIQGIADGIDGKFRELFKACIVSACIFQGVQVWYTNPGTDVGWTAFSSAGEEAGDYASGSGNADMMPDQSVAVIRKVTGKHGREDRGRLFISGMPEAGNINGRLESSYAGTLVALAQKVPEDIQLVVAEQAGQPAYETYLHARHWNRKDNVLRPITAAMVNSIVQSREDRRAPLIGLPIPGVLSGG